MGGRFVGNLYGSHAPDGKISVAALQVGIICCLHGLAVPVIREASPGSQVGITLNLYPTYPASNSEADVAAARIQDGFSNRWFLEPVFKGTYPEDLWAMFGGQVPRIELTDLSIISRPRFFWGSTITHATWWRQIHSPPPVSRRCIPRASTP